VKKTNGEFHIKPQVLKVKNY